MVLKPIIDEETGLQYTEMFMTNWCDINGLVPKWLVNVASASVPKGWAKTYELGCMTWM